MSIVLSLLPLVSVGAMGIDAYTFNVFSMSFGVGAAGYNIVDGLFFPIVTVIIPAVIIFLLLKKSTNDKLCIMLSLLDIVIWIVSVIVFCITLNEISSLGGEVNVKFWFFVELIDLMGLAALTLFSSKSELNFSGMIKKTDEKNINNNLKTNTAVTSLKKCPSCNSIIDDDSDFCSFCGTKYFTVSNIKCSVCGAIISDNDTLFCTSCGAKLVSKKCKNCGVSLDEDDDYCPMCGNKYENDTDRTCEKCGKIVKHGAYYCSKCGNKFE